MITSIDVSQEIFAIDILKALKSSLKHHRKHVLRPLQLYGDQALVNRLLPIIVETDVHFWQLAYIKERDLQELIFCFKTAIDDFKHRSSKFYTLFVDFRDAFGSLDR